MDLVIRGQLTLGVGVSARRQSYTLLQLCRTPELTGSFAPERAGLPVTRLAGEEMRGEGLPRISSKIQLRVKRADGKVVLAGVSGKRTTEEVLDESDLKKLLYISPSCSFS